MVIAYLRVSTNRQHVDHQKAEIEKYVLGKGLKVDRWYSDTVSGRVERKYRKLGELMEAMQGGDVLVVTEVSRLSRSLMDIMNIIHDCLKRKIVLHCVKEGYIFEDNMNSKILGFAFGLVAEIERNLISARTREALHARRACGVKLGRPEGSSPKTALLLRDLTEVREMVDRKISYHQIAVKYKVSVCTVNRFVRRYIRQKPLPRTKQAGNKQKGPGIEAGPF